MRVRLKLLVVCLLLCVGFDFSPAIAAAQVEAMVEGTGEHILVGQTSATPSPEINGLPVDEDVDDPEDGVITASRSVGMARSGSRRLRYARPRVKCASAWSGSAISTRVSSAIDSSIRPRCSRQIA